MAWKGSPNHPSGLSGRDLQIFSLHMLGKSNLEIAQLLGIVPQTVSNTINATYFQEAKAKVFNGTIDEITKNTAGAFSPLAIAKANAAKMMQLNVSLAENAKSEQVRHAAIKDILDRVIGRPTQRIAVEDLEETILARMSDEELEAYIKNDQVPEWAKDAGLGSKQSTSTVH